MITNVSDNKNDFGVKGQISITSGSMRGSRKFCQRGPYIDKLFLEGRDDPSKYNYNRAIIGPPAKRHLNGVSLARRQWPKMKCWLGSLMVFQGIRTSIPKKPYIFCDFPGGRVRTTVHPLDPPMASMDYNAATSNM